MKRKIFLRIVIMILVVAILIPVIAQTASAVGNEIKNSVSVTNTSNRLAFLETENAIYYEYQLFEVKLEIENKEEKKNFWKDGIKELKSIKTIDKAVASVFNIAAEALKDPQNVEWQEIVYSVGKSAVSLTLSAFGLGGIADAAFGFFEAIMGGSPQKSEIAQLQDHIDEQFEEVNENLDDIRNDLSKLSDSVSASVAQAVKDLEDAIEAQAAGQEVIKFTSSGDGNFDYTLFKEYLYGISDGSIGDQAYLDMLVKADSEEKSEEIVEEYYKLLYRNLMSTTRNGISNIDMLRQYITENEYGKKSIQRYYYDWLSSNRELLGDKNAEFEAVSFTLDLYRSYLFAENCIFKCNEYFFLRMCEMYGEELNDDSRYYYGTNQEEYITYGQLKKYFASYGADDEALIQQMVSDIVYIYNMEGSYIVENNGEMLVIANNDAKTFGQVRTGQTIYMNRLGDFICGTFDFDPQMFRYKFVNANGEETINDGIYKISSNDAFSATLMYGDYELYTTNFVVNNNTAFSGGSGTEADPYLIGSAEQLYSIYNMAYGYEKCYKLISDIDIQNEKIPSLYNRNEAFTGTFDGNGYTIKNAKIKDNEYAGLFAKLGYGGVVKNLTVDNFNVSIIDNYNKDVYAGAIAAINEGSIFNCNVKNSKVSISVNDKDQVLYNKNVTVRSGGIAGVCQGEGSISYCTVVSTAVSAESYKFYGSYSDSENGNYVYAGGIAGTLSEKSSISNCYFCGKNSTVTSNASIECDAGLCTRSPYANSFAGGIAAKLSGDSYVSTVYADYNKFKLPGTNLELPIPFTFAELHYDNICWVGLANDANCKELWSECVPNRSDIKCVDSLEKLGLSEAQEYTVDYQLSGNMNLEYNCLEEQLYNYGEDFLKTDGLKFIVNGKVLDNYTILNYYGLDTLNSDKVDGESAIVRIVLGTILNGNSIILHVDVPITVKKIQITELVIEQKPDKLKYDRNEAVSLNGGKFSIVWEDGTKESVIPQITKGDTAKFGTAEIQVSYLGFLAAYEIVVDCVHNLSTSTVLPTCTSVGYKDDTCSKCDYTYKYDFTEKIEHTTVVRDATKETCVNNGYTGDEYCSVCESLIKKGEEIPLLPHTYKAVDGNSCKCEDCEKSKAHEYSSIENSESILYYCATCDYTYSVEKRNDSDIAKVVVGNSYGIVGSENEIVVYIKIFNNPGIAGVSFRIEYDDRLEYVNYERGELLSEASAFEIVDVNGVIGFVAASADEKTEDGNLLKLIFKLPDDAKLMDKYDISIALTGDRFANGMADSIDIVTMPGSVTAVTHLPGDVNNDGLVDILDTALMARYIAIVNTKDTQGWEKNLEEFLSNQNYNFSEFYADVNLDGKLTVNDLVIMLQYFVGKNIRELQSNEFEVVLNPNNGSLDIGSITVKCYDDDGNRSLYPVLPTPTRDGYRFDGWFLSFDVADLVSERINEEDYVVYNSKFIRQTLYAHWTEIYTIEYIPNKPENSSSEIVGSMEIQLLEYKEKAPLKPNEYILTGWSFIGWSTTSNGKVEFTDCEKVQGLAKAGSTFTLYAVWEPNKYSVQFKPNKPSQSNEAVNGSMDKIAGCIYDVSFELDPVNYSLNSWNFIGWSTSANGEVLYADSEQVKNLTSENGATVTLYAVWERKVYTLIFDSNKPASALTEVIGTMDNMVGYCNESVCLTNNYSLYGWSFLGWSRNADATASDYSENEIVYFNEEIITLYAIWGKNPYTIEYCINAPNGSDSSGSMSDMKASCDTTVTLKSNSYKVVGYNFMGWALTPDGEVEYVDCDEVINLAEPGTTVSLYAQWEEKPYTIDYVLNGGLFGTSHPNTVEYDKTFTVNNPTRLGYTFAGWTITGMDNTEHGYWSNEELVSSTKSVWTDMKETQFINLHSNSGTVTFTANWIANTYAIEINVVDVTQFLDADEYGNPKYGTNGTANGVVYKPMTIYYTYGDVAKGIEQGYYTAPELTTKLSIDELVSALGDEYKNFEFGGLFESKIDYNGHSYASYDVGTRVVSSAGAFVSVPSQLHDQRVNVTLYALLTPKQYTITLDADTSSQPGNSLTNSATYTKTVLAYYNELPENIAIMPQSTYYVPVAYGSGIDYFDSIGQALHIYNISGNVIMKCRWEQTYKSQIYIYDRDSLETIRTNNSGKTYRLIKSINVGLEKVWEPIDSFAGTLLGDGHYIYNFRIERTSISSGGLGFINNNYGTIKGVNIGSKDHSQLNSTYSVIYYAKITEASNAALELWVGGIAAYNGGAGIIENCRVENTYFSIELQDNDNDEDLKLKMGGICAINFSTIKYCDVEKCNLVGYLSYLKDNHGDNNIGYVGGICSYNCKDGTIEGCELINSSLKVDARGNGYDKLFGDVKSLPKAYLGGIAAVNQGGAIAKNCQTYQNTFKANCSEGTHTTPSFAIGRLFGQVESSSTISGCKSQNSEFITKTTTGDNPTSTTVSSLVGSGSTSGCSTFNYIE